MGGQSNNLPPSSRAKPRGDLVEGSIVPDTAEHRAARWLILRLHSATPHSAQDDGAGGPAVMSGGSRMSVILFILMFIVVFGHGVIYALTMPPWDVSDEEQHLDYALTIRDDLSLPRLHDYVHPRIIQSAHATDRWAAYH